MSDETQGILLLLVAGFFAGGAYSARNTSLPLAVIAGVLCALALASAVLRLV